MSKARLLDGDDLAQGADARRVKGATGLLIQQRQGALGRPGLAVDAVAVSASYTSATVRTRTARSSSAAETWLG